MRIAIGLSAFYGVPCSERYQSDTYALDALTLCIEAKAHATAPRT